MIAVIGAGNVGSALAQALTRIGEPLCIGVPDPEKYQGLQTTVPGVAITTVAPAIEQADLVILAVPYPAALAIANARPDWQNKILVDVTNPLAPGLAGLTLGTHTSAAEAIAAQAHNARVVKAFNTTGAENMLNPVYPTGRLMMPVCSDHIDARAKVLGLAEAIGFAAVDCGELAAARYLEPFGMTWIHLAFKQGRGRAFGFGLLERPA
ncbi:NADPH-dependent F420 reductase [Parvibium lacunae]|nr:NAD(P)-binding domain-containing protein [Parvibium lacunae]